MGGATERKYTGGVTLGLIGSLGPVCFLVAGDGEKDNVESLRCVKGEREGGCCHAWICGPEFVRVDLRVFVADEVATGMFTGVGVGDGPEAAGVEGSWNETEAVGFFDGADSVGEVEPHGLDVVLEGLAEGMRKGPVCAEGEA